MSVSSRLVAVLAVCAGLAGLVPGVASARDVYFNGVKLEPHVTVKNQTFANCEVRFDLDGNVYITAKGYKVSVTPSGNEPSGAAAPSDQAPAKVTKRYWLVAPQPRRVVVQYDLEVYLNGTLVKRIRAGDDKAILEVTRYVRPGLNSVRVLAIKNLGNKRLSSSPQDVMELVVGEGVVGGGTVTIDRALVSYKRTAAETGNFADSYGFQSR
jgi:hypothetical protein